MIEMIPYPTRNGLAVSPFELELPERTTEIKTNHHGCYFARLFGHSALHHCFRNLDSLQWQLPENQHQWIHDEYDAVRIPTPLQMWHAIHYAQERNQMLRYGSAKHFELQPITKGVIDKVDRAYHKLK